MEYEDADPSLGDPNQGWETEDDEEDDEDVYGKTGRTPETLLNYICDKYYGWSWCDFQYDLDVNFN